MARYRFSYQTIERYDTMVYSCQFLLRCTPMQTSFQTVEFTQLNLLSGVESTQGVDSFGNIIHYGMFRTCHDIFVVACSGEVAMSDYVIVEDLPSPIYKSFTPFTVPNKELQDACAQIKVEGSPLDKALAMCDFIFKTMEYSPKSTSINTTAAESFAMRKGVCQDYTHLLLSMCRMEGIFARYVVGFVVGTGETHSWAEVYSNGKWYGVDPTHNIKIDTGYIKVSHGRDAADCSVIRGIQRGVAKAEPSQIRVVVEEI